MCFFSHLSGERAPEQKVRHGSASPYRILRIVHILPAICFHEVECVYHRIKYNHVSFPIFNQLTLCPFMNLAMNRLQMIR